MYCITHATQITGVTGVGSDAAKLFDKVNFIAHSTQITGVTGVKSDTIPSFDKAFSIIFL